MPSLDNYTPYKATCPHTCTTYRNVVQEQRTGTTYRNNVQEPLPDWGGGPPGRRGLVPRRWWTLVAVGLATFMTYLDR
jgi:hypothetical protein